MISSIHNSIELMRALHSWWRSLSTKEDYDVTVRLKKDEAPYFENIVIPSAYKIKQEAKASIVRGYEKITIDGSDNYNTNSVYIINKEGIKDIYLINFITKNGNLNINFDEDIIDGTQIDMMIRTTEVAMYGLISQHTYINVGGNIITGALVITSAISNVQYNTQNRSVMDVSLSIEKIDGQWLITSFMPMPTYVIKGNNQAASVYYQYGGNFKDPFDV